jgi:hypothetical protein
VEAEIAKHEKQTQKNVDGFGFSDRPVSAAASNDSTERPSFWQPFSKLIQSLSSDPKPQTASAKSATSRSATPAKEKSRLDIARKNYQKDHIKHQRKSLLIKLDAEVHMFDSILKDLAMERRMLAAGN